MLSFVKLFGKAGGVRRVFGSESGLTLPVGVFFCCMSYSVIQKTENNQIYVVSVGEII